MKHNLWQQLHSGKVCCDSTLGAPKVRAGNTRKPFESRRARPEPHTLTRRGDQSRLEPGSPIGADLALWDLPSPKSFARLTSRLLDK
jgi:hypothetical protein